MNIMHTKCQTAGKVFANLVLSSLLQKPPTHKSWLCLIVHMHAQKNHHKNKKWKWWKHILDYKKRDITRKKNIFYQIRIHFLKSWLTSCLNWTFCATYLAQMASHLSCQTFSGRPGIWVLKSSRKRHHMKSSDQRGISPTDTDHVQLLENLQHSPMSSRPLMLKRSHMFLCKHIYIYINLLNFKSSERYSLKI